MIGNTQFNSSRKFLEDMELYAHVFQANSPLCAFLPLRFYAYRKHGEAISTTNTTYKVRDSFAMCDTFAALESKCRNDILLQKYFQDSALKMYYWTLETLSQDPYFHNRVAMIKDYGLKQLQKRTLQRVHQYKIYTKYHLFFMCPPTIGVQLCRWKTRVSTLLHYLKSRL